MRSEPSDRRSSRRQSAASIEYEGFEATLDLDDDDDEVVSSLVAADEAEGPLDPGDDEDLITLPKTDLRARVIEAFGPEEYEDEPLLFGEDDAGPALDAGDADGPLLDYEADLGLTVQDEPAAAPLRDEGAAIDETFELLELPPLGDCDDGALFDEALDEFELEVAPPAAPSPPWAGPPGQDHSPRA